MLVSTSDYDLTFTRLDDGTVEVSGNKRSLDIFKDTLELAGESDSDQSIIWRDDRLEVPEGTVAMWLSFEALNFL